MDRQQYHANSLSYSVAVWSAQNQNAIELKIMHSIRSETHTHMQTHCYIKYIIKLQQLY